MGIVLILAVAVALVTATAARVRIWTDGERALWYDALQKAPDKPRPWVNLGNQYSRDGLKNLAEDAYVRATALADNPQRMRHERVYGFALAQANLAQLEINDGHRAAGIARLRAAMARYSVASVRALLTWHERQSDTP